MRAGNEPYADGGSIHITLAIGSAAALLLMTALVSVGTNLDQDATTCQIQPDTSQASAAIPPNYLQLYRKVDTESGLAWNLLAAIGKVESDHGQDPHTGVRSGHNGSGAAGPMQIGIGGAAGNTWGGTPRHRTTTKTGGYGIDGDHDGWADVYNPADAIPAAANYLKAHGAPTNTRQAIFAYNHDPDYVTNVLAWADRYADHGTQAITSAANPACEQAAVAPLPASQAAAQVITYARAQLGKPYVWGATGPDSFDCSGLTLTAYRSAGITIPRTSQAQYQWGALIPQGQEQPGDLIFFDNHPGTGPSHVGIIYNPAQGTMIAAPHKGAVVRIQSYKNYPTAPTGITRPTAHHS